MTEGKRDSPISLGTQDYTEAVIASDRVRKDWELGKARYDGSLVEAMQEYLEAKRKEVEIGERSKNTQYRAERQLLIYDRELALLKNGKSPEGDYSERDHHSVKLRNITKQDIQNWQQRKKKDDLANGSINTYTKILAAFFNWCVEEKKLSESPFAKIKIPKVKWTGKRSVKFFTFDERDLLLKAPPTEEISFVLHLGFYAGLRYEEMNAMESDWIKGDVLKVKATKHFMPKDREAREIPLNGKLKAFLKSLGTRSKYLFAPHKEQWNPSATNRYRYDCKKSYRTYVTKTCGLEFQSFHSLRRSFATHLYIRKTAIEDIADWLGDDVGVTKQHYIGYVPSNNSTECL